jgi:hypothetical protein
MTEMRRHDVWHRQRPANRSPDGLLGRGRACRHRAAAPAATIYAAILREIQKKGDEAEPRKAARGKSELAC